MKYLNQGISGKMQDTATTDYKFNNKKFIISSLQNL
jgi:hypothetical protein